VATYGSLTNTLDTANGSPDFYLADTGHNKQSCLLLIPLGIV